MTKYYLGSLTRFFLSILFISGCMDVSAQSYILQRVTSVEDGGMYVFEQFGRVFNNTISNYALQTTDIYKRSGLTGDETYVWVLQKKDDGFYMKNPNVVKPNPSDALYLYNSGSSTNVTFGQKSSVWSFLFQDNGTALIQNTSNSNRFLGLATDNISYRAYAYSEGNLGAYEHDIVVYKLVEGELHGDINTDGRVDISDVTSLIDIILGRGDSATYDATVCDLNDDTDVDISDVTTLIDIILGR